jgi:hypothetical protein
LTIDGTQQPGHDVTPIVVIDGGGGAFDELVLGAGSDRSTIEGLGIEGSGGEGILVESQNDTIGGPAPGDGDVISGNQKDGVLIETTGITVQGNRIGTDASGTAPVGNRQNGVEVTRPPNTPEGLDQILGNTISGNIGSGILLDSGATDVTIQGNVIGTNADESSPLANGDGVSLVGVGGNRIEGNTISGNAANTISANSSGSGISISDGGTGNLVTGNLIGTNSIGGSMLGNAIGIAISAAPDNTIGGLSPSDANTISGNTAIGIEISVSTATGNLVEGNRLGLNQGGKGVVLPPDLTAGTPIGILIDDAGGNRIGGTATNAGNTISGFGVGIDISGPDASGNAIEGDKIGTYGDGSDLPGSVGIGVYLDGVTKNTVGGTDKKAENFILGYSYYGVYIYGTQATDNAVQGNQIGTGRPSKTGPQAGIAVEDSSGNILGGSSKSAGNTISGNEDAGIYIFGQGPSGTPANVIAQNVLDNNAYGILLYNDTIDGSYQKLESGNRFAHADIAKVREFSGPVPPGGGSSSARATKGQKRVHRAAEHAARRHRLRVRPASRHPEVVPADRAGGRTEIEDPVPHRDPASATEPARVSLRRRVRPTTVVPGGPLAHRTLARLNRPPSAAGPAGRATDRSAS